MDDNNKILNWFTRAQFDFDGYKGKHYDFPMVDLHQAIGHFTTNSSCYDFMSFPFMMRLDNENNLALKTHFDAFSYVRVDLFDNEKLKRATLLVEDTPIKVIDFVGQDVDTFCFCDSPLTFDPHTTNDITIKIEILNDMCVGNQRRVMVGAFIASLEIRKKMAMRWWNAQPICTMNK